MGTVGEIVLWVVLAGVVGLVCGWLVRSLGRGEGRGDAERRITRAREEALAAREESRRVSERTAGLEEELAGLRGRAGMQATLLAQRDARIQELERAAARGEGDAEPGAPPPAAERAAPPAQLALEDGDGDGPAPVAAAEPDADAGGAEPDAWAGDAAWHEAPAGPADPAPTPSPAAPLARDTLVPAPPEGVLGPASAAAAAAGDRHRGGEPVIPLEDEDDLRRIRGVGPVLEAKLRVLGVHTYRQIAAWSEQDVEDVSKALGSFPDRVRRDRWVASARELHRRKYGAEP